MRDSQCAVFGIRASPLSDARRAYSTPKRQREVRIGQAFEARMHKRRIRRAARERTVAFHLLDVYAISSTARPHHCSDIDDRDEAATARHLTSDRDPGSVGTPLRVEVVRFAVRHLNHACPAERL